MSNIIRVEQNINPTKKSRTSQRFPLPNLIFVVSEIMADVQAIKECCDDAILAFGGRPIIDQDKENEKPNRNVPNRTETDRTERNRTESNRTERNRTESNRTERNRTETNRDIFQNPPRVEMSFKRVLKSMTVGE